MSEHFNVHSEMKAGSQGRKATHSGEGGTRRVSSGVSSLIPACAAHLLWLESLLGGAQLSSAKHSHEVVLAHSMTTALPGQPRGLAAGVADPAGKWWASVRRTKPVRAEH